MVLLFPSTCFSHFWHKIKSSVESGSLSLTMMPAIQSFTASLCFSDLSRIWKVSSSILLMFPASTLSRLIPCCQRSCLICCVCLLYFSGFCIISSHSKMVRSIPLIELPGIYGCPYGFFMHAMICIFPFSNCISPAFKVYAMHLCISSVEMRFRIAQCFRSSLVSFTMKRSSSASKCFFFASIKSFCGFTTPALCPCRIYSFF